MSDPRPARDFRLDVQGLRAVAVMLVVLYHLFPGRVSGGYVGVDVFFVISGYLITRHLASEVTETGRVRLVRFWARRARRLLPASLLVLGVALVLTRLFLPTTVWSDTTRQVMASALYVQNWILASDAVDYSAANSTATLVQHYWSLSVEEQFYVLWPVFLALLVGAVALARRAGRLRGVTPRHTITAGLVAVFVVSLTISVLDTAADQARAYFVTPTRLWEFALGGLLGLVWHSRLVPDRWAALLGWAGLAAIGATGFLYSDQTAFPGWLALLPVLGTVAVLAGGAGTSAWGPGWLRWRPVTFIGDISYAIYLWHWPLAIVMPHALDREMDSSIALLVLGLSIVLAWLSTRFFEDPLRRGPVLRSVPAALTWGAAGMAVVVLAALGLRTQLPETVTVAIPQNTASCVGPGALDPANDCGPVVAGDGPPTPPAAQIALQDTNRPYGDCQANGRVGEVVTCEYGVPRADATHSVAVVGDSHATAWLPALVPLAEEHGWNLVTYTMGSCPMTWSVRHNKSDTDAMPGLCSSWVDQVNTRLVEDPELDTIFTASNSAANTYTDRNDRRTDDPAVDGFREMWAGWREAGKDVVAFDDVPQPDTGLVPTCVEEHDDPLDCATKRTQAVGEHRPLTEAIKRDQKLPGMHRVDVSDQLCDDTLCYVVVGRLIGYRDSSHLSQEYAEALAPFVEKQLPASLVK